MDFLKKVENKLAELYKGAPKLSNSSKETVVKVWPWLALVGGILQVWAAISLFRWARWADDLTNSANEFFRAIGAPQAVPSRWSVWVWTAIIVAAVQGVLLLVAFPKLRNRAKAGWDILFLVGLLNLAYGVVSLFIDGYGFGGGFGSLIWNVIVSAVVFWLLFAVRDKYKGADFKLNDLTKTNNSKS